MRAAFEEAEQGAEDQICCCGNGNNYTQCSQDGLVHIVLYFIKSGRDLVICQDAETYLGEKRESLILASIP